MSDYWLFEGAFETGDATEWSGGETDTQSKMSYDHYAYLVQTLGMYPECLPYRGAYCAHVDLSIGTTTTDAYVSDTSANLVAGLGAGLTVWFRFFVCITSNLTMAADDCFTLFTVRSASADEAVVTVSMVSTTPTLVAAETSALAASRGAATRSAPMSLNQWHLVELGCTTDSGGGDGVIQFYVDGFKQGASIATLTQAAITNIRLGAMNIDSGSTAGHILLDQFAAHTAQLGGFRSRYPAVVDLTKSGFAAVGPGKIESYSLVSGGATDNLLTIYDTDILPVLAGYDMNGPRLANTASNEARTFSFYREDGQFHKGCYVQLSGTAPRAIVSLAEGCVTTQTIRRYGQVRKTT